jgi:hypothetical protein
MADENKSVCSVAQYDELIKDVRRELSSMMEIENLKGVLGNYE